MDFTLNEDELALRDGIRSLLEGRFAIDRVREGLTRGMWKELGNAGVFSLDSDGFGWPAAAVVFEELGAAAIPGPLVSTFLATDLEAGASTGERLFGLLDGRDAPVIIEYPDEVDDILVLDPDGIFIVPPGELSLTPSEWPLDPLTPVAIAATLPKGARVGSAAEVPEWRRNGALLTAALQVGLARRALELGVAYAKEREQFGKPIGAFQAVKHICADMAVSTELARVAVHEAAVYCEEPELGGAERAVSTAKALAGEAARQNGKRATQVFGGMGYTWEVDVHLLLKRAWVLETHFGSSDDHADAIAATLGA
jgi:alkylation response protein AidB-like acyl-CoA dehydrogenase